MKRKKTPVRPAPPPIEHAIRITQAAADRSSLPQMPYASFVAGFGWCVDSTCHKFPSNADHVYPVSVLPANYCRPAISLW